MKDCLSADLLDYCILKHRVCNYACGLQVHFMVTSNEPCLNLPKGAADPCKHIFFKNSSEFQCTMIVPPLFSWCVRLTAHQETIVVWRKKWRDTIAILRSLPQVRQKTRLGAKRKKRHVDTWIKSTEAKSLSLLGVSKRSPLKTTCLILLENIYDWGVRK